jgi:hypothetical protein
MSARASSTKNNEVYENGNVLNAVVGEDPCKKKKDN